MRRKIVLTVGALLVAAQLVPARRENPPVTAEIFAPPALQLIFERACYNCHSNETEWPWYSRIAPVSWLVAHDVEEGREHLNFSTWESYSLKDQLELREEIWEEVEEGEMPLWFYVALHRDALLSEQDKKLLKAWSGQPILGSPMPLE